MTKPLLELFQECDRLANLWVEARNVEEKRLRELHASEIPPEPGPVPERLAPNDHSWHRKFLASTKFSLRMIDLAEEVPSVKAIMAERDVVVNEIEERMKGYTIVGSAPGLARCVKCGSPCSSIPRTMSDGCSGHTMDAMCHADETHINHWLPWGG